MEIQEKPRNTLCFQVTEGSQRDCGILRILTNHFSPNRHPGSYFLLCIQGTRLYLDRAVFKHIHSHFLLFLLLFLSCGLNYHSWELLNTTELQEDGGSARVALYFHPQDAIAWPFLSHVLQAVNGRAGKGDVNVSQDEEHKESLCTARNKAETISPTNLGLFTDSPVLTVSSLPIKTLG